MPEPGWYQDEDDLRLARWFDGFGWTRHTVVMDDWDGPPPPPEGALEAPGARLPEALAALATEAAADPLLPPVADPLVPAARSHRPRFTTGADAPTSALPAVGAAPTGVLPAAVSALATEDPHGAPSIDVTAEGAPPLAPGPPRPTSWWRPLLGPGLVLLVVVAVVWAVVAGTDGDGSNRPTFADESTTTAVATTASSTTVAPAGPGGATATTVGTTQDTTGLAPAQHYEGTGPMTIDLPALPTSSLTMATITHSGDSTFAVYTTDAKHQQLDLVVNQLGHYAGTVPLNFDADDPRGLDVQASGPWTIDVKSVLYAPQFDTTTSGSGDDIRVYTGVAGTAAIHATGTSNFAIRHYSQSGTVLVVNEIGAVDGTYPWPAGVAFVQVLSNGPWTIDVK